MSKITQNYIEARRDGIKWLNSQKRDYSTGVNILTRSGYKGFVAARLARQGEKPHTREKLEYEIRQMIKVWYHPDDPRFEDVDLADDAMPGNDGRSETVPEETAAAIVAVAERGFRLFRVVRPCGHIRMITEDDGRYDTAHVVLVLAVHCLVDVIKGNT